MGLTFYRLKNFLKLAEMKHLTKITKCGHCGNKFQNYSGFAKFCSVKCSQDNRILVLSKLSKEEKSKIFGKRNKNMAKDKI